MTSETRIYDNLLLMIRLGELHQEYFGGEIVDVGQPEGDEGV